MSNRIISANGSSVAVRDPALDMVKGALVIIMVVYHAMNIFTAARPDDYSYVRFVSGSFILVSGYIVARFHEAQFKIDWRSVSQRLIVRGLKLLMLFTMLNVLINLAGVGNPSKAQLGLQLYADNLFKIYVSGEPTYASFQILLPIAYLMCMAPALLMLGGLSKWLFPAGIVLLFALSLFGVESINLGFGVLGATGIFGGILINSIKKPLAITGTWSIGCSLLVSEMMMKYLNANSATYALGTMLILKLLYDLSRAVDPEHRLAQEVSLLGQYSLVCYIAQIIFMQALYRGLWRPHWELGYETIIVVLGTVCFLLLFVAGLATLRERYSLVGRAYKVFFA